MNTSRNVLQSPNLGLRKKAAAVAAFLILVLAISSLTSCLPVRLIGDYDDTIDKGITDIQQRAEKYFSTLKLTPNTPYDPNFYADIDARMAVLKTRATVLPKYSIIVQQVETLQSQFNDLQKLDQGLKRPVASTTVTAAQTPIEVTIESILRLELALQRGSPPSK